MPASRGVAMLVLGLGVYGLAWYTHIGWYYLASGLLFSVLAVNLPLPWLTTRNLSVKRRAIRRNSAEIFEDGEVTLEIEIHNRSFSPKLLISVDEHCPLLAPGEERLGFLFGIIGPSSRARASYDLVCYKRGVYSFPPLQLYTSAPFGLFRSRRSVDAPLEITVYPKVLAMGPASGPGRLEGRTVKAGARSIGGEFRGSREHQLGDNYTNIHWRNSARLAKIMVKEFDHIPRDEVRLAFDTTVNLGDGRDTTLEYCIKIAASLAFRFFQDGRPFSMLLDGQEEFFTTWQAVLQRLAGLEPGSEAWAPHFSKLRQQPILSAVIVSAADSKTLAIIRANSTSIGHALLVLLEGFGNGENPHAAHDLRRAGIEVVSCRPGNLAEVLASLSSTMQIAGFSRAGLPD